MVGDAHVWTCQDGPKCAAPALTPPRVPLATALARPKAHNPAWGRVTTPSLQVRPHSLCAHETAKVIVTQMGPLGAPLPRTHATPGQ